MRLHIITFALIAWLALFHTTSLAQNTWDCELPPLKPIPEYAEISSVVTRYELVYLIAYTFYRPFEQARCVDFGEGTPIADVRLDHWANHALEMCYDITIHHDGEFKGHLKLNNLEFANYNGSLSQFLQRTYRISFPNQYETFEITANKSAGITLYDVITIYNKIVHYINKNSPQITREFVEIPMTEKGCMVDMARIETGTVSFCMDIYEFPNQKQAIPATEMTGRAAALVCAMEGKRLCTADEWQTACQGPENEDYIYGSHYLGGFCNDFLMSRGEGEVKASGEIVGCVNGYGLHDMSGNLAEWTAPEPQPDGTTVQRVRGGSFSQDQDETALSCSGARIPATGTDAFSPDLKTLGTRCCTD